MAPPGLYYNRHFIGPRDRAEILDWLSTLHPIWEYRYSGDTQRRLLRPVYWLGSWQFACLNYYRPPKGIHDRCVRAEPFPPVLARLVAKIETIARRMYAGAEMPKKWHLNVCLVNFYGSRFEDGKKIDTARVGEHKDFEPGPVASLSIGERALFQFVTGRGGVVTQQWLDDGSLQIFGGARWKSHVFHRVQRVDRKSVLPLRIADFETRRVNFTLRYVPDEHVVDFAKLPDRAHVESYVRELAEHSAYWRGILTTQGSPNVSLPRPPLNVP